MRSSLTAGPVAERGGGARVVELLGVPFREANTVSVYLNKAPPTSALQYRIQAIQPADYIWQRDRFQISVDDDGIAEATISFGDNIQDEWMVVFIIMNLSLDFPDLVAQLTDDDGQFLLVEAANVLPRWVKPETCESRAFIFRGEVHIVPMRFEFTSLNEACEIVRQNRDTTISQEATAAISKKLRGVYDSAVLSCQHYGRCMMHKDAVQLLDAHPWLITRIVEAFYFRDPIDLRHCSRMLRFTPTSENYIWNAVRFTHCSFAQLEAQKFAVPNVFEACRPSSEEQQEGFLRGVKLMCGLEILFENQKRLLEKGKHATDSIENVCEEANLVELVDHIDTRSFESRVFEQVRDDDPSRWININQDEMEDLLQSYSGGKECSAEDIVRNMHKFMSNVSDFDGISNLDTPISFDTTEFMKAFLSDDEESEGFYEELSSIDEEMAEYQEQLDRELDIKPINADINLVKNIIEAYKSESGQAGPASTILGGFGIHLPDDIEK